MNKLSVNNKELYIVDNLFSNAFHSMLYGHVTRMNNFALGFGDTDGIENKSYVYYTADFGVEHLEQTNIFNELYKTNIEPFIKNKQLIRATINTSTPGQINFPHTHINQLSLVYYLNLSWKPEWAGETLFYNDDLSEIEYASIYKPNRGILFDGEIPHSLRCQSINAPQYRFSLAMFFEK